MLGLLVLTLLVSQSPAGFTLRNEVITHQEAARPAGQAQPDQQWPPPGVSRPGAGTTAPKAIRQTNPSYTADALRAGVEGSILLGVVVKSDGTVGEVRVVRSLDKEYGLDDRAVTTVRKWRFEPGKKEGVAVPVLVDVEITFSIRN